MILTAVEVRQKGKTRKMSKYAFFRRKPHKKATSFLRKLDFVVTVVGVGDEDDVAICCCFFFRRRLGCFNLFRSLHCLANAFDCIRLSFVFSE